MNKNLFRISISSALNISTIFSLIISLFLSPSNVAAAPLQTPLSTVFTTCAEVTEIPQAECEALVALYNSTGGANWTNNTNWLQTDTPCNWYGIGCNVGKITNLNLSNNNLIGSIPIEIGTLTELTGLFLDNNYQIMGDFPTNIRSLVKLETLRLHHTQTSGNIPSWIGELVNLRGLHLENNQLSGSIPVELTLLPNLETLNISMNQLTGSIPGSFGNMTSLRQVYLGGNQFSGGFPVQFTGLPDLEILHMYDSGLSGTLPIEIGDFPVITSLDLSNNSFSGPLPTEIGNLLSLQELWLGHNNFSGEIPASLTNLINLRTLFLDNNNQITGVFPSSLRSLVNLEYLQLHHTQTSGTIPSWIGELAHLKSLHLENNQLTGSIPVELTTLGNLDDLNISMNQLTGSIPSSFSNMTSLRQVYLGGNQFSGGFPVQFTGLPDLEILHMYDSGLSGTLPIEIGDFPVITSLNLSNNSFSGPLPTEIGNLLSLQELWLGHNDLAGEVPSSITNLVNLNVIDVCGLTSTDPDVIAFLDSKNSNWRCSNARFHAQIVQNDVQGYGWPVGASITLTIDDPTNGTAVDFSNVQIVDSNGTVVFSNLGSIDLAPGMYITMADGTVFKDHTVTDLMVTNVDADADTVSGTGSVGASINVQYCDNNSGCAWRRWATVQQDGTWSVNFSITGTGSDEQEILDITLNMPYNGEALEGESGGITDYAWNLGSGGGGPSIASRLTSNYIDAWDWPEGTELTLTIEDPNSGLSPDYYDDTLTAKFNDPLDPNSGTYASFWLDGTYILKPGDEVTVDGGGITRSMTVADLHITTVDIDNDSISGTAGDGIDQISVRLWSSPTEVVVDANVVNNIWTADFSGIYDLGLGDNGVARWWDANESMTSDYFHVPNPNFNVRANNDQIELYEWSLNSTVTLEIDDPSNGTGDVDYTSTANIAGYADWDPNRTYGSSNLSGVFDIQPGFIVKAYDGTTTKTHTVTPLAFTDVDVDNDTVTGTAAADSRVDIWACDDVNCFNRHVDANGSGVWIADFSQIGIEPDEQNTFDIIPGTWIDSQQPDDDRDSTMFGFQILWTPPPTIPLVFAISSSVDLSVPRATVQNISVLNTLLDSLFRLDKDGNLQPLAATSYSVSPNGLVYTVTLRSGALWSDGQPVTAQHYVDGILRVLDPNVGSDYGFILYPIQNAQAFNDGTITDSALVGVKALNDQMLEFTLGQPTSHFSQLLASPVMLPARQDVIDLYGNAWTTPAYFVSNGLYKLMEHDDAHIVVEENTLYDGPVTASFSQIGFSVIPDFGQQVTEYKNGNADVLLNIPINTITNDPVLKNDLTVLPSPGLSYIGFTTQVSPTNDPLVRKALASAIDRQILIDDVLMTPWRVEATGVIPPELPGYQGSTVGYSYNPVQAQAFLAQAGYPGGAGFPVLNLIAYPSSTSVLEEVKTHWETVLGITVNIDYVSYSERTSILADCKNDPSTCVYNGYFGGWAVDYPDAYNIINDLFSPDTSYNYAQWDNANYRNLINSAVSELDPAQRVGYLQQAEQILVQDDAAVMPLYYMDGALVVRPGIYPYYSPTYFSNLAYWSDFDPAGDGMTSEVIGTNGGIVTTEDNTASIDIPTGALDTDVTLNVTDLGGNYQITTSQQELAVLTSYSIQPHGLQFAQPVTLTFAWNDSDNNGIVDGTIDQLETKIVLIKDGEMITPACEVYPSCDTDANTISADVLSLSHFELTVPGNAPPIVDADSFAMNEFIANGTSVGIVAFSDTDSGQSHICEIHEGNTDNAFAIDANSCEITVNNSLALGYATNPTFNLTVRVTDNGTPARYGDGVITINITPPPTCYTLTLSSGANGSPPTANPLKSNSCASNGQYIAGEAISLTAHPDSGYQVAAWFNTDDDNATALTNQITMPASHLTVMINYGLSDATPPVVDSITLADASPTNAANVNFTVTISESVTGVDSSDFSLNATGVIDESIVNVTSVSGSIYIVTVNTGFGNGTIRLDVVDDNSIVDSVGNPLGGVNVGDGDFTTGEVYDIDKNIKTSLKSIPTQDGWIVESTETSGVGGLLNSTGNILVAGDNAKDKQYVSILSFNTSGIPDNAVITSVKLRIRVQGFMGDNLFAPLKTHGNLVVDMGSLYFGANVNLMLEDFEVGAGLAGAGVLVSAPVKGNYTITLDVGSYQYVDLTGKTQVRLRFELDDNDDLSADYINIFSGDSTDVRRPKLIIEYYVP